MLSLLRTQVNTILPVAGGCHISLAKASQVAAPASGEQAVSSHHGSRRRRTWTFVEHCPRDSGMETECGRETEERPWPISSVRGCQRPEGTCSLLSSPALLTLQVHHEPRCPGEAGAYILPGPASDTDLLPAVPSWAQRQTTEHPGGEVWGVQAEMFSSDQVQPLHSQRETEAQRK